MDFPLQYYLIAGAILLIGIVIAGLLLRKRQTRQSTHNPYIDALKLLVDGNADGAFQKLQESVRSGLAPVDAYIKLGALFRERGEITKALQVHQSLTVKTDLSKAEKIELFSNLAADHAKMGNSEKAASVLETAIRNLHIKDPDVMMTLAKHYHVMGEREKAYDALREVRKLGGAGERELALFLSSSAESLVESGDLKDAKKLLQRATKHDAECAPALLGLGAIAEKSNDVDEAIHRWKQVAVLSPELATSVLSKLEGILYEKGRFGDIEKVYEEVRAARAGDETATISLARFYRKQGRSADAIELLEDFVAVHPESIRGSLLLTSFYAKHRDTETVERFLQESLKESADPALYRCMTCQMQSDTMRWHCPRCNSFDSYSPNHAM